MARIRIGQQATSGTLQQTITSRIKAGKVVPIISNAIITDLVLGQGQYQKLVETYAQHVRYAPDAMTGQLKLPQITQYVSVVREQVPDPIAAKELYIEFIKSWLFDLAEQDGLSEDVQAELDEQFDSLNVTRLADGLGYPKFDRGREDPLLVLASFPLPIYLTTSHHYFIEMALQRAGKEPRTMICPWRESVEARPFVANRDGTIAFDESHLPSELQPLVYHLHGFDQYPESLVLTEDDYMEFLVGIARDKGRNTDPIPTHIREALVESSLLLLGYHLRSWDFRVLFWGLIKADFKRRYKSISVQLDPQEVDEKYLQNYLSEADFDVYRGTVHEYIRELQQGWEG
ncbi:MAG: SIR2 family protein [Gammaproteobacteria bacterium]|nr:SIR2 family protein [Gammaproteobacteria bacterium]